MLRQFGSLNITYQDRVNDGGDKGWSMNPELIIEDRNDFQVSLKSHTNIPPHSMLFVKVDTNITEDVTSKAWIVEPSASLFTKKGVSLGHSIITNLDGIYLTNLTNRMQYIPRGTCLAKLEAIEDPTEMPINSLTGVIQKKPQSSENLKDKLKDRINQSLTRDEKSKLLDLLLQRINQVETPLAFASLK